MTRAQFHVLLDELLQYEPGTIRGTEELAALPKWDSVALIGFIAVLDQHFGMILPASQITSCRTVADLRALVDSKLT